MSTKAGELPPVKGIKKLREDNEIVNPLTDEHEALLILHAAPHLQDLTICGVDTGMRRGEMFDLTWDKVDLERRTIRIEKTKTDKPRTVPITNRLLGVLRDLKEESKIKYVFVSPKTGGKLTKIDTAWRRAHERAGLRIPHEKDPNRKRNLYRFHDLRGTFITRLVEEGKNLLQIKQLSGHSTTRMLERYARPGEESGRDCIDALDRRRERKVIDFEEEAG